MFKHTKYKKYKNISLKYKKELFKWKIIALDEKKPSSI